MANNTASLDSIFYALGHPARRTVVQRLGAGPATVGELAAAFNMMLPSFMKHIGILERTGLIRSEKVGRVRTCSLERKQLLAAERWFEEQRSHWASRYDKLDDLLTKLNGENL